MSTPTILVRAAPGRRVPLSDGTVLNGDATPPQDPVLIPRDLFAERRLAQGDLVVVPAEEE